MIPASKWTSRARHQLPGGGPTTRYTRRKTMAVQFDGQVSKAQADRMIELSEQQIIDQLRERLSGIHERVDRADVSRVVQEEYSRVDGRLIRDFIPLFVGRHSRERPVKLGAA